MTRGAAPRRPSGLDASKMLRMVEFRRKAAQSRKALCRRIRRVEGLSDVADRTDLILIASSVCELNEMTAGAIFVGRELRFH